MPRYPANNIAVIFIAQRTDVDEAGYRDAATAMVALAKAQDGFVGIDSVREENGLGITISYWENDVAAKAWRDNAEHSRIRDAGRNRWYSHYSLHVACITRSYDWKKA